MQSAGNFVIGALKAVAVLALVLALVTGSMLAFELAGATHIDIMSAVITREIPIAIGIMCIYLAITYYVTRSNLAQISGGVVASFFLIGVFARALNDSSLSMHPF